MYQLLHAKVIGFCAAIFKSVVSAGQVIFKWFYGAVLVLHTSNIKYTYLGHLGIICIAVGKNRKENMEGLKMVQLSTIIVTLLYSTLLDDLPVKGLILLDFLAFYS